jgi:hypothetical protein
MKLCIKQEDKIYGDIKFLIDNQKVTMGLFDSLFKEDGFRRDLVYGRLSSVGLLDRKIGMLKLTYSAKKFEFLEDKTIILYDKLTD